jgi:ELWxxDGT repeat protein
LSATDGVSGAELWKTDGTGAGTVLVKDINPGAGASDPLDFTAFNNAVYFRATDGTNGFELWRTDGTAAGTVLVKDMNPGAGDGIPVGSPFFTVFNGALYFIGNDGTTGGELWRSDGTEAGTVLVKDIHPGANGSFPSGLTVFNGALYFAANDGTNGSELWRSDGTEAGTVLVKDIDPRVPGTGPNPGGSGFPSGITVFNGALYFRANDGTIGEELWRSDGTEAGTVLVKDICAGGCASAIAGLTVFNGMLYFPAHSAGGADIELWRSDGTEAGTVLVKDINPGANGSSPFGFTVFNGALYFSANDGTNGPELWRSDGTEAGTVLVKDINPAPNGSFPFNGSFPADFAVFNGTLYFHANDGTSGNELWRSDGTAAGTVLVKDIPGANSGVVSGFTILSGALSFFATDANGRELWRSDGTAAGTVLVKDACPGPCDGMIR